MTRLGPLLFIGAGLGLLTIALVGAPLISATAVVAVLLLVAVTLTRLTLGGAGVLCAVAFAFTTPWNAVAVGPVRPADVFLLLGLGLLLLSTETSRVVGTGRLLPWWVLLLALVIVGVAVCNAVLPFAPDYLRHRTDYDATGAAIAATGTNMGGAARWLISLIGVPVLVGLAGAHRRNALRWIAIAFAAGTAITGLIAVTDDVGLTAISHSLIPDRFGTRQASLTIQPNHLATVCVLGLPMACWLFTLTRSRVVKSLAALGVLLDVAGVLLSGSRGGAAVGVLGLVFAVLMLRDLRARLLQISIGVAVATAAVLYTNPQLVGLAESTTRFTSTSSVVGSDQVRDMLARQADLDFSKSPLYGIGLQVIVTAHNIFKQLLASGGVLLFLAFAVFIVGLLRAGRAAWQADQLSVAAAVSVVSWLVLGGVENILIDRYLYVPVGLLMALGVRHRSEAAAALTTNLPSRIADGAAAPRPLGARR